MRARILVAIALMGIAAAGHLSADQQSAWAAPADWTVVDTPSQASCAAADAPGADDSRPTAPSDDPTEVAVDHLVSVAEESGGIDLTADLGPGGEAALSAASANTLAWAVRVFGLLLAGLILLVWTGDTPIELRESHDR